MALRWAADSCKTDVDRNANRQLWPKCCVRALSELTEAPVYPTRHAWRIACPTEPDFVEARMGKVPWSWYTKKIRYCQPAPAWNTLGAALWLC